MTCASDMLSLKHRGAPLICFIYNIVMRLLCCLYKLLLHHCYVPFMLPLYVFMTTLLLAFICFLCMLLWQHCYAPLYYLYILLWQHYYVSLYCLYMLLWKHCYAPLYAAYVCWYAPLYVVSTFTLTLHNHCVEERGWPLLIKEWRGEVDDSN